MKKNQKISFTINFNSYNPHAYVIKKGYFIKYFLKKENREKNTTVSDKENKHNFKININLNELKNIENKISTSVKSETERDFFKERNINNQLEIICQSIDTLKKQGLSKEEILEHFKNLLYNKKENTKQKTKTLQK